MFWVAKTLWKIAKKFSKNSKLIFITVSVLWSGLPTLIVGKILRKKIVLRLDAQRIDYTEKENKLAEFSKIHGFFRLLTLKIIFSLTLPFYDFVIGISKGVSEEAKKYGAKQAITIPIAVNIKPFLSKSQKTKQDKPTLLYVGQIKKIKGVDILIKAFWLLKKEGGFSKTFNCWWGY